MTAPGGEFLGWFSTGTFNQSAGTNSTDFINLSQAGGVGTYNLSGNGQLIASSEYMADYSGIATFTQTGGTNSAGALSFAMSGGVATYNLDAGMLIASSMSSGTGTTIFNFGGATLKASGSLTTTIPMTLTGSGGNATIDTAGYTVTLSGSLSGPGGLIKTDSGTLVLTATNTFTGDTTVSGGTLQLNNAQAVQDSTVNVNANNGLSFGTGIGTFTLGGLAGSGSFSLADTAGDAVALQVGGNNANTAYSGALSGSGSLTKIGSGVLQLDGNNTFSGPTTINAGTLAGTGTLAGAVMVNCPGAHRPGR